MIVDTYYVYLCVYVAVMCWIILGFGFRLPELARWEQYHKNVPFRVRFYEIIIVGILLWPWCNPTKLWDKYDDN